jgi:micrococcal nuclease
MACAVTRVVDGDTLQMTCGGVQHRVRLLGFDTPEVSHAACSAERAAGERSTRILQGLVAGGPVTSVRFKGQDRYGRDLADVAIGGRDLAEAMLRSGGALPYSGRRRPDWCGILGPDAGWAILPILPWRMATNC